jgi:hypothetical protein
LIDLDQAQVLLAVIRTFEQLDIKYAIGGSLASSVYGLPRATNDIDLIADVKPEHASRLVEKLRGEFYVDAQAIVTAIRTDRSFNLIHLGSMFKIDVFVGR